MPKNCRNFPFRKAEEFCKTEAESTQTNKLLSYSPHTLPIAKILSAKNARAWVSMDFT